MNNPNFSLVHDYIERIMPQIERPATGKIQFPWLSVTAGDFYASTIYTWDFHHAAMRFAIGGKPQYLRHFVDNLLAYQQPDGHTPHVVNVDRGPRFLDVPSHAQPFVLQAAFMYVNQTGDKAWGNAAFEKLTKYVDYFDKVYSTAYGLKRWRTNWLGGVDNDVVTAFVPPDSIASCDINGWLYIELLSAQKLAAKLERSKEADAFARRAQTHRQIVNEKLWHDPVKSYAAFDLAEGRPLFQYKYDPLPKGVGEFAFQSGTNLMPLYARMADADRARAMIETYVIDDKHFWSPYGIRTLSRSSEYFNNAVWGNPSRFGDYRRMCESNWQGPVWMPLNYFTFEALRHYGFNEKARELADNAVATMANSIKTIGSFSENFHSETGQPLYAKNYASWNLLADVMHDDLEQDRWIMESIFAAT